MAGLMHEHTAHPGHAGHDMDLNRMAVSATLHCLTGCAIGEVAGVALGTAPPQATKPAASGGGVRRHRPH